MVTPLFHGPVPTLLDRLGADWVGQGDVGKLARLGVEDRVPEELEV